MQNDGAQVTCSSEQEEGAAFRRRPVHDLARFTLKDMSECGAALRRMGEGTSAIDQLAGRITRYLYDSLVDRETGEKQCALARFFMTREYRQLDPQVRSQADQVLGESPSPNTKCLTLLGTAGELPDWNTVEKSSRYRAIPLTGEQFLARLPMISLLFRQLGVKLREGDAPFSPLLLDGDATDCNVFYIPDAVGSPFVPDQDEFVKRFGIRSVLGFGGLLPCGELFAVILFSRIPVSRRTADLFRVLALSAKLAILPVAAGPAGTALHEPYIINVMNELLAVQDRAVGAQSERLTTLLEQIRTYAGDLERSHALFQSFVEHTPAAVAMLDRDLRYLAVSRRWVLDYRLENRNLIGCHHYDVFPEIRQREDWQDVHRRCLAGGVERREEDRLLRADGSEDWLRWEVRPWYTAAGGIGGIIIFTEVITDRKRTEVALGEIQERFSKAFDEAPIGMALVATDGRWLQVNQALCEIVGYPASELTRSSFQAITHPDDLEADLELVHRLLQDEIPNYQMEKRYIHKQGHAVWILLSVSLVRDTTGTPLYFIAQIQDITERKRADAALRENEDFTRTVLDSLAVEIAVLDRAGTILAVNESWRRFARRNGASASTAIGPGVNYLQSCQDAVTRGDRTAGEAVRGIEAVLNGRQDGFTMEYPCRSGEQSRWFLMRVTALARDHGGVVIAHEDITERKLTEETSRRLISILDATSDFVGTADLEGRALYVNEAGCRMAGIAPSDVTAMIVSDFHPDWAATIVAQEGIPSAIRNGVWAGETAIRRCDGREIPVSQVVIAHRTSSGQVEFLSTIMRDITDRKKAELALQSSEAQLQAILDNSPSLIFKKDPEGRYLRVNKRFADVFGMSAQQIIGKTDEELFPSQQARMFRDNDRLVLQSGTTMEFEETTLHKDGRRVSLVHKFPLFDRHGRIEAIGGIATDITARKREQDAQARLAALVTSSQDAIISKTLNSVITSWNEGAERMFGYSADEIIGRSVLRLIPPERRVEEPEILRRVKRLERIDQYETVRLRKDGSLIDVSISVAPIKDQAGRVVGVAQTVRDVTERKRAEAVLREREARLSRMLDEREQLSQNLHDNIVQMLVACGLGLEGARSSVKSDPKQAARGISRAITELNLVIEDVRHYIVGLDPGIRFSTKRFGGELQRVIQAFQAADSPKFLVRLSDVAVRRLTPDQAKHLLLIAREAFSNAVRHGDASTVTVSLSRKGSAVRFAVTDDGKGFNVSRARNEGYGLRNMALRARRVKARFQLVSKRGKGTRIFVDLPASESA